MAKTLLFGRLTALLEAARSDSAQPESLASDTARARIARRAFFDRILGGVSALAAAHLASACGDGDSAVDSEDEPRIAIIGGGMAGLHCAYLLEAAGVKATIYEASKRTGGRMYTARDMFPDAQVAELGGELIDSGHLTMRMLAKELDIQLDDRDAPIESGEAKSHEVWWVKGEAIPEATIVEQFKAVAPLMKQLLDDAESSDDAYAELDATPMDVWLDENLTDTPELKSVLENAYRGEYGLELDQQSVLNLIYLIGSDEPEPFRIFGVSDERYHTHTGSETFPEKLAARLKTPVEREHELVEAAQRDDVYELTFKTRAGEKRVQADYLVFALPFSKLRQVELGKLGLSDEKRQVIDELGYGTNAKVMGAFKKRVWLEDYQTLGSVTADEPFQQIWDTSLGQPGEHGLLTNFVGGTQGIKSGEGSAESWYTKTVVPGAETVFPGSAEAYVKDSAVRMHWPSYEWNRGSYACYMPGQWSFWSTEGLPERDNTIHFCGEHTSLEFQGYMEGAAETGALVAGALLEELGKQASGTHEALLALQRSVAQPAYGERVSGRERRRRLRSLALALKAI
jgi:monoamine oxidase